MRVSLSNIVLRAHRHTHTHTGRGAAWGRTPGLYQRPALMGSDPTRGRQCGHTGSTRGPGKNDDTPTHTHTHTHCCREVLYDSERFEIVEMIGRHTNTHMHTHAKLGSHICLHPSKAFHNTFHRPYTTPRRSTKNLVSVCVCVCVCLMYLVGGYRETNWSLEGHFWTPTFHAPAPVLFSLWDQLRHLAEQEPHVSHGSLGPTAPTLENATLGLCPPDGVGPS